MTDAKICTRCNRELPITEFYRDASKFSGRRPECKQCISGLNKGYYEQNKQSIIAHQKEYYQEHREEILAWWSSPEGRVADRQQKQKPETKAKTKVSLNIWRKKNLDRIRVHHRTQVSRRRANWNGSHTTAEWESKLAEFGHRCAICHRHQSELANVLERDHIVPVSWGGSDKIANIQPLCRSCNAGKGGR